MRKVLRTKLVATIGPEGRTLFNLSGDKREKVEYEELFKWFIHPEYKYFMIDVLRLNMAFYSSDRSNNKEEPYKRIITWMSQHKKELAKDVGIICDLAGAKTRLGEIQGGEAKLEKSAKFKLFLKDNVVGNQNEASVLAYGEPLERLNEYHIIRGILAGGLGPENPGVIISIGDGKTELKATHEEGDVLYCTVEREGIIKTDWGVTFEHMDLGLPSFQRRDQEALRFLLDLDRDEGFISFIGVSFVRKADDILDVRHYVEDYLARERGYSLVDARLRCPDIIAKIETAQGVSNIEEILDVAEGVMIARGDLALQLGREAVPEKQKEIISMCNKRGKTVITATEMLASMEDSAKPTRAEVNDVFNAILDGTDAVMLSGETASGKYPAQAVNFMATIAERAEKYFEKTYARESPLNTQRIQELRRGSEDLIPKTNDRLLGKIDHFATLGREWEVGLYTQKLQKSIQQGITDRICAAACELAEEKDFKAIVASTASGRTVRMLSRFRPSVPLIAIIYDEKCRRKLSLMYAACPLSIGETCPSTGTAWHNPQEVFTKAAGHCLEEGYTLQGEHVIFISGSPLGKYGQGKVNILQIKEITDEKNAQPIGQAGTP